MMAKLGRHEIVRSEVEADVIVVNSCTVTNGADSSVRHYVNHAKRLNEEARVLLTGCGAHSKGEELFDKQRVFGVFGHSEKEQIAAFLESEARFYELGDLAHIDTTVVEQFIGKSRAFIKIQEGCDFRCSYCIIPFVRGAARSLQETLLLEQITKLAGNGFGEFILTGTNVGSYGRERGESIAGLLKKISAIRGVRRVRIGSLEPIQVDAEFLELLDEPWMARHLHIALQHTSDAMLAIMNRRNRFAEDLRLFETLAAKGYALGTDFIVGHPGENDARWAEAMQRIRTLPLTHIHAFTYSKRDGTQSALMKEGVNGKSAKMRYRELTECVQEKSVAFRKRFRGGLEVLVESEKEGRYWGLDQFFNKISIASPRDLTGEWIGVEHYEVQENYNQTFVE